MVFDIMHIQVLDNSVWLNLTTIYLMSMHVNEGMRKALVPLIQMKMLERIANML